MTVSLEMTASAGPRTQTPRPRTRARLIAFYLPQFHPIPENNAWWGEGFTEWRNVAKARPLFPGHYQPHLPADLGFYDLRVPEVREAQAELARAHGIEGFCYWHYWFHGKRLLERPFAEVLASGRPDFPFCLAWANEPWTRRWDGLAREVLQPQSYSEEDDRAHLRALLPALRDPRAITVDGKPVFLVYRPLHLADPARTVETWRAEARHGGLPGLHLIGVEDTFGGSFVPTQFGFDAGLLFQPSFSAHGRMIEQRPLARLRHALRSLLGRKRGPAWSPLLERKLGRVWSLVRRATGLPERCDYQEWWRVAFQAEDVPYPRYHTVFPAWDNTTRLGINGFVFHNSTPEAYEQWLCQAIQRVEQDPPDHRLVFINAWNEWAEGAHLEPDLQFGHAYLEVTRRAVVGSP